MFIKFIYLLSIIVILKLLKFEAAILLVFLVNFNFFSILIALFHFSLEVIKLDEAKC